MQSHWRCASDSEVDKTEKLVQAPGCERTAPALGVWGVSLTLSPPVGAHGRAFHSRCKEKNALEGKQNQMLFNTQFGIP